MFNKAKQREWLKSHSANLTDDQIERVLAKCGDDMTHQSMADVLQMVEGIKPRQ